MSEFKRYLYSSTDDDKLGNWSCVQSGGTYFYFDGTDIREISGDEVIKIVMSEQSLPVDKKTIQNAETSAFPAAVCYKLLRNLTNKIFFDLKNTTFSFNFDVPFPIGVFRDGETGTSANGRIILGTYALPYTVNLISEMYGFNDARGYKWVLGDNLIERNIYDDQEFKSLTLRNVKYDKDKNFMTCDIIFEVYSKGPGGRHLLSDAHPLQFDFKTGEVTINFPSRSSHYRCPLNK